MSLPAADLSKQPDNRTTMELGAVLPLTAEVKDDHLYVGGVDMVELAREQGTALYVMDEADMRLSLIHIDLPLRFARAGKEDRFAQMAAAGVPQIGFGLGAITRIDGAESVNTRDLARYCAAEGDFAKITEEVRKTR